MKVVLKVIGYLVVFGCFFAAGSALLLHLQGDRPLKSRGVIDAGVDTEDINPTKD